MLITIAIYSNVLDSKINPDNTYRVIVRCFRSFYHNAKVEDVLDQDKICLTSYPVQSSVLVLAQTNRDYLSTFQGGQRKLLKSFPGHNPLVIDDGTIEPELRFDGLISLVSFTDLGNSSDGELGRKARLSSYVVVRSLVDVKLVSTVHLENNFRHGITGFVEAVHGIQEKLVLLFSGLKLEHLGLKYYVEYIGDKRLGAHYYQEGSYETGSPLPLGGGEKTTNVLNKSSMPRVI